MHAPAQPVFALPPFPACRYVLEDVSQRSLVLVSKAFNRRLANCAAKLRSGLRPGGLQAWARGSTVRGLAVRGTIHSAC